MKEAELVSTAIKELLLRGVLAWREQSGSVQTKWNTHLKLAPKGTSDIVGCLPPNGRFLAAEAKTGNRKTTPEQDRFLKVIKEAGGVAFVFRSIEELHRKLDGIQEFVKWEKQRKKARA